MEDYFGIMGDVVFNILDCLFNCWLLSFDISLLLCLSSRFPTARYNLPPSPPPPARALAVGGVRQRHLAAEHFPVERWEAVGGFRVDQAEKLQLIDVEVANGLHCGQLGHHLWEREKQRGEFMNAKLCARTSGWGGGAFTLSSFSSETLLCRLCCSAR